MTTPPNTTGAQALSDEQIIERCKAAGIKWIAPDLENDPPSEGGFPGSFDMVTMAEMRSLLVGREQAGAVACKRCHGSGSVEDGQITHHECGIPYENGPVQCMKDCPACNGAGKFFAGPSSAIAARERRLTVAEAGTALIRAMDDLGLNKSLRADIVAAYARRIAALASREEAPAASATTDPWLKAHPNWPFPESITAPEQSALPNAELLRGWKRYEKLRKLTPAAFNRLHAISVTGGNSFDDLVDALPEPSTPVPEQSAKGLTMGGEAQ